LGTIYLLKCSSFLKVGFTSNSFDDYLQWIRARIPFEVTPLLTRIGSREEELEFHRSHKENRAAYGGREWYEDTPEFRQECESLFDMPGVLTAQNGEITRDPITAPSETCTGESQILLQQLGRS
jgi:hypothetical protein